MINFIEAHERFEVKHLPSGSAVVTNDIYAKTPVQSGHNSDFLTNVSAHALMKVTV